MSSLMTKINEWNMPMQLLPKSPVGKKFLMALTGQVMLVFVILHVVGNSTIFFNRINAYAEQLHALPLLVWGNRLVMLILCSLHVVLGIQLYIENRTAKPQVYSVKKSLRATIAGRTMIWTGLVIGAFLVYHLLHFTFQVTNPEFSAVVNLDAEGRPDVFRMVVSSFRSFSISFAYVIAMTALMFHMIHGIQSSFQSIGLNNDRTMPVITRSGFIAAVILFLGYVSIPVVIVLGIL